MNEVAAILTLAILCLGGSFHLGDNRGIEHTQDKAAQTECARYHPDTGKFEWLGEE